MHTGDVRPSQVLYELTSYLVLNKWRDSAGELQTRLFGQLKRIARQWLDGYLICKGNTYPAQLKYKMLADMACEKITAGITRSLIGERAIEAVLDPYNPIGSTAHVNFNTSKTERWETDASRCHINWVILDSDWEGEFCRVAESHPKVKSYVKNHNLGLEVPYRYGSVMRRYIPDFIVNIDDGHGEEDLLHLIVEIKGYRGEDAKEKKTTMDTYWVPGVNNHGRYGRWAFAEFTDVYEMQTDFEEKVEAEFNKMITLVTDQVANTKISCVEMAYSIISKQFGDDQKWNEVNTALWSSVDANPDNAFHLSDLDVVTQSTNCTDNDILAILGLLSTPSMQLLQMELQSKSSDTIDITLADYRQKLKQWWKDKVLSDDEWTAWAGNISIKWVPVETTGKTT